MNRREVLQIGAAAAALPALRAQSHHAFSAAAAPADWTPRTLDAHQNETVIALTEIVIPQTTTPGAKAALVNRYIDLFLTDGPQDERVRFVEGVNWLDGYALRTHQRPFIACTPAQQNALLEALDAGSDPALASGAQFFRMAKGLTARIYYNTRAGYDDLNRGGRVPASFGCQDPGHHS